MSKLQEMGMIQRFFVECTVIKNVFSLYKNGGFNNVEGFLVAMLKSGDEKTFYKILVKANFDNYNKFYDAILYNKQLILPDWIISKLDYEDFNKYISSKQNVFSKEEVSRLIDFVYKEIKKHRMSALWSLVANLNEELKHLALEAALMVPFQEKKDAYYLANISRIAKTFNTHIAKKIIESDDKCAITEYKNTIIERVTDKELAASLIKMLEDALTSIKKRDPKVIKKEKKAEKESLKLEKAEARLRSYFGTEPEA